MNVHNNKALFFNISAHRTSNRLNLRLCVNLKKKTEMVFLMLEKLFPFSPVEFEFIQLSPPGDHYT